MRSIERKWWVLTVVCAAIFMLVVDLTIVVVALPEIQGALGAGFSDLQWVVDAYALTLASFLLTAGVLADRHGRRLLFAIGLAIFTLGSLLCGLAGSPGMLIGARCVQGVGGATIYATSLALLGESFRGTDRRVALGIWGGVAGIAVALGPVLGGLITSLLDWRAIFFVNVPVGIAALAITWWQVEESRAADAGRTDWAGFGLLTGGLLGVVYGLIEAGERGWRGAPVLLPLIAGGALLVAFVIVEATVEDPLLDLSLFRVPTFLGGAVAAFAMNASLFAIFLYLVLYLQDVLGLSALGTGLRLLLISGGLFVAAAATARLADRVPVRALVGVGLGVVGIGLLLMSGLDGNSTWTHLVPGFLVAGVGAGLVNPPLASTAIGVVPPARAGMASGINSTFRQIGIASGIAALGSIFVTSLHSKLVSSLAPIPGMGGTAAVVTERIRHGRALAAPASLPASVQAQLEFAVRDSFARSLDELLVITGIVALIGGIASFALIRAKDFVDPEV